ncbi:ALDH-like protein [Gymnopus androsaceus JB14]|uniref:ALDH-like protein n=1 Tax=Gymnopus androsaceus JB14 TaxID=1447944 RepID=A0A6A4I949_9AGAR|nr:ALDH-like protein [Gymnopus androsaceus JB14]
MSTESLIIEDHRHIDAPPSMVYRESLPDCPSTFGTPVPLNDRTSLESLYKDRKNGAPWLTDFLRFGVKYVEDLTLSNQGRTLLGHGSPTRIPTSWGFVFVVTPFNFTAIGGNLRATPALVGDVVVWKPSPAATYSIHRIFTAFLLSFAALNFTGSTFIFKKLWKDIAANMDKYKGYPRVVGETGGKNFHVMHKSAEIRNAVIQSIRGQKRSVLSRLYVSSSVWTGGFEDQLLSEISKIKVGSPLECGNFLGPVIGRPAFDKIMSYIQKAKDAGAEILTGGTGDGSKGYFVQPTVILTKDPRMVTMVEEIFGPILTAYVFDDEDYEKTLELIDTTTEYGLTGAIFTSERKALITATNALRNAAGNVYYNEKCTGAVAGQQPFGDARASGTNDKAGNDTDVIADVFRDVPFLCPASLWIAAFVESGISSVFRYEYGPVFPDLQLFPNAGAWRSTELQEVFGTYNASTATQNEVTLSKTFQTAIANFIKNPNEPPAPNWPKYVPGNLTQTLARLAYVENVETDNFVQVVTSDSQDTPCKLWDALLD